MVSTAASCHDDWMFIRSVSTGNVITAQHNLDDPRRSQVMVAAPRCSDEELWRWDGQFLRNKATNLVLDIRNGIFASSSSSITLVHLNTYDWQDDYV